MFTLDSIDSILSYSRLRYGYDEEVLLVSRVFRDVGERYYKLYLKKLKHYSSTFISPNRARKVIEKYRNVRVQVDIFVPGPIGGEDISDIIDRINLLKETISDRYMVSHELHYYKNGVRHNDNGPAYLSFYRDGGIQREMYFVDGKRHRDGDLPSYIDYYPDGSRDHVWYYKNEQRHRDDGPACIRYFANGNISKEEWYSYGKLHRWFKPAVIYYDMTGCTTYEAYYVCGVLIKKCIYT